MHYIKRRPRRGLLSTPVRKPEESESSDEDLGLTRGTRSVRYKIVDGIPGLRIQIGSTMNSVSWTPIASRTRSSKVPR